MDAVRLYMKCLDVLSVLLLYCYSSGSGSTSRGGAASAFSVTDTLGEALAASSRVVTPIDAVRIYCI